jgi:transposase
MTEYWKIEARDARRVFELNWEGMPMLRPYQPPVISPDDIAIFDALVFRDHWVRRAESRVDFQALRAQVAQFYELSFGSPAVEPVLLIKLELLMYQDNLSDSQVYKRAETDLGYRWFLGLGRNDHLPDVSTLGRFRSRIGVDGHKALFHSLLKQAREYGLVKDRLRIKDATHVIADIAVPAGLTLVAQARNRLLNALEPFDLDRVTGERVRIETMRTCTDGRGNEERLIARIDHLRDILAWASMIAPPSDADSNPTWQTLVQACEIARKTLAGHDEPTEGDKLRSVSDPDARRGRHGEFYDGYMVDVMVDADSQMFTAINVLPGNGNESADALELVQQETLAHSNAIEQLSIDGAGYDGPVLRKLEDEHSIDVFVPAKADSQPDRFTPEQFPLSEDGSHVTCPAGEKSQYKQRDESRHTTTYRFEAAACNACPLFHQCIGRPQQNGRSVRKNDFAPEYDRVRERVKTPEYTAVKKEHPMVERNLGHLMNRYGCRRARYRGRLRVLGQLLMGAMTANLKRMIRLLDAGAEVVFG